MYLGIKFIQPAKRLTLRVNESFFRMAVGVWRNIQKFHVRPAGGDYSTTYHPYKIVFNPNTVVSRSNFMNDEFLSPTLDEILIDVLGQVYWGNKRKKLEFTLRDIKIPCCIWGNLTDILHSACNQDDGVVTLLLRFAKPLNR
ncbi:LOW QUALITY PROTEIN: hypothetical protein HID58_008866 [Brassica napus]|uniref:Replication protein A 70 kDa DNA-binding subunit B/D first OB fold domain-containing protein n=1 Tax=Brassica napus TaxID=3708 RepID=A0ABQ8DQX1_BRANA|nr:LOW QUALITY PROTEIN: hypothetical protein HID58_008866 [Brassica napus]